MIGEFDGRFGQHLASHRHIARDVQSTEWAFIRERRQTLRRCPGHRAAHQSFAGAQVHGDEIVAVGCETRAAEAQQHAALIGEFCQPVVFGGRELPDIGNRDDRNAAVQHLIDSALVDFGVRRKRLLDVIDIRQQGLFDIHAAA